MKSYLKVFVLLLLISAKAAAQVPAETIPDFTFYKLDKTPFSNKNLARNKMIFFIFFDATCSHCQHTVQALNTHYNELKKPAVYFVSLDKPAAINGFMNKYGKNFYGKKNVTLLQDAHTEFIVKFKPRKYPGLFLYSPQKKLLEYSDNEETLPTFLHLIKAPAK